MENNDSIMPITGHTECRQYDWLKILEKVSEDKLTGVTLNNASD